MENLFLDVLLSASRWGECGDKEVRSQNVISGSQNIEVRT